MEIDIKRVSIVEKDIEDWLWENPQEVAEVVTGASQVRWIARQYKVPSGILDLLGIATFPFGDDWFDEIPLLVEVKHQPITSAAIAQICRYEGDMKYIIWEACQIAVNREPKREPMSIKLIIGPGPVADQVLHEADAMNVSIHTFSVHLSVNLHYRTRWTVEAREHHRKLWRESATSKEMKPLRDMIADSAERARRYQEKKEEEAKLPVPFTEENGDCSFAENGDLL